MQVSETRNALANFVQKGYFVYKDLFDRELIKECHEFIGDKINRLNDLVIIDVLPKDINGWSVAIMQAFERTTAYEKLITTSALVATCREYVGPDVAWFSHDGLFINVPSDDDPVTAKAIHTDTWTGTGLNTVFATIFFTDADEHNGITVWPGSHLQGMWPVRDRTLSAQAHVHLTSHYPAVNLKDIRAGDAIFWHPLLLHATTGHSDRNIRISMTSRFTSTETAMTSQERALGYRTLSVGPLNQVLRLVGNDYLMPYRTLGGYTGVDRRMATIYNHSPFKAGIDYGKYL